MWQNFGYIRRGRSEIKEFNSHARVVTFGVETAEFEKKLKRIFRQKTVPKTPTNDCIEIELLINKELNISKYGQNNTLQNKIYRTYHNQDVN